MKRLLVMLVLAVVLVSCGGGKGDGYRFDGKWTMQSEVVKSVGPWHNLSGKWIIDQKGNEIVVRWEDETLRGTCDGKSGNFSVLATLTTGILLEVNGQAIDKDTMKGKMHGVNGSNFVDLVWTARRTSR